MKQLKKACFSNHKAIAIMLHLRRTRQAQKLDLKGFPY